MAADLHSVVEVTEKLLSPAAPQVLDLVGSRDFELDALRRAVELDPVLTVKIMDYANHSFYARRVPVASLHRALVRLGWETSCEILMRLVMEMAASKADKVIGQQIWEHSLKVAVLARVMARASRSVDPAMVYTAGLVHGIGQLGLLSLMRDRYSRLFIKTGPGPQLAHAERKQFGFDHARVGAGVLSRMSLPETIPGAILRMYRANLTERPWEHHPELPVAALLQLAQFLLHRDAARLDDPEWLSRQPLAEKLAIDHIDDIGDRYRHALNAAITG